jgi:nucleotide sugar dehydrogenase
MAADEGDLRLSVVGLGKLGAPMAAVFGCKGFHVVGLDLNPAFVEAVNAGRAPVDEPDLQDYLTRAGGNVRATTDYAEAIGTTDVTFIIVPTPSGPDLLFSNRYVIDAVERIGAVLRQKSGYHLVVVTSTVMPGSTGGEIRAALERSSGRRVGSGMGLCYNPEFIALGSVVRDMLNPDMLLIGESDPRAGDLLEAIYRRSVDNRPEFQRMNWINAELCKIAINTYVTTKISYANMVAEMCDHLPDADARVVTWAVGSDSRIGRKYLKPAIGYGGPCFPRDNKAFSALGRALGVRCDLAEATDKINDHQLFRLRQAVEDRVAPGRAIAILGLSYKPHTVVMEESQGVMLAALLAKAGYRVSAFDPLLHQVEKVELPPGVTAADSAEAAIAEADAAVVTTPWPEFKEIDWQASLLSGRHLTVIDPWDVVGDRPGAGIQLVRLGQGSVPA